MLNAQQEEGCVLEGTAMLANEPGRDLGVRGRTCVRPWRGAR
jgi:hypothetical protein